MGDSSKASTMTVEKYVNECVNNSLTSVATSRIVLELYKELKERYPNLIVDALCSEDSDSFMLASDVEHYHIEFERVNGEWEFFHIGKNEYGTDELGSIDFANDIDFDKIDHIIKRLRC